MNVCPVCKYPILFTPRGEIPHYDYLDYHESGRYDREGAHRGSREYYCPYCGAMVASNEEGTRRFLPEEK
jgi:DNA-directed RNA polymerase subunit RPC12/RpoP